MDAIHYLALFGWIAFSITFALTILYAFFGARGFYGWHAKAAIEFSGGQMSVWNWKHAGYAIASFIIWWNT